MMDYKINNYRRDFIRRLMGKEIRYHSQWGTLQFVVGEINFSKVLSIHLRPARGESWDNIYLSEGDALALP